MNLWCLAIQQINRETGRSAMFYAQIQSIKLLFLSEREEWRIQLSQVQMLRICSLAGETVATFSADEVEDKSVKVLKIALAKQIGVSRFRQRWLSEDRTDLHDDAIAQCCDVQLVLVPFVESNEADLDQLSDALAENQPHDLEDLLRRPLNPNAKQDRHWFTYILHGAAADGNVQIVQLLLEAGIDPDTTRIERDEDDATSTSDDETEEEVARIHGTRYCDFVTYVPGLTALHLAAFYGRSEVMKLLLEAGADKDAAQRNGMTALHAAAFHGDTDVVKLLLKAGADKDAVNAFGMTALKLAAGKAHSEVVKLLLQACADKDAVNDFGMTALHSAARKGHSEVVKLLLEAGADKDAAQRNGMTALHVAATFHGDTDVVKLLLKAGADKDAINAFGMTALNLAAGKGHSEVVKLLLQAGADKDAVNGSGMTALHSAARKGHSEVVNLLLEAGADKDVRDMFDNLPLDLAICHGFEEVVHLLQSKFQTPKRQKCTR